MGIVYKAYDPRMQRYVALKTIVSDSSAETEVQRRFLREAVAAGRLSHTNIVTVHDLLEHDGKTYLVMEYLDGGNLEEVQHSGALSSLEEKLRVMIEVCAGLDHAHSRGIIHRDMKPANVFLTATSEVKILDFGIARIVTSLSKTTQISVGTPHYMSPEQWFNTQIDYRTDIFSSGVMLYEMLTGRKPFDSLYADAVAFQVKNTSPATAISKVKEDVFPELGAVVVRAMARDPDDRYSDAQEMEQALREILDSLPERALQAAQELGAYVTTLEKLFEENAAILQPDVLRSTLDLTDPDGLDASIFALASPETVRKESQPTMDLRRPYFEVAASRRTARAQSERLQIVLSLLRGETVDPDEAVVQAPQPEQRRVSKTEHEPSLKPGSERHGFAAPVPDDSIVDDDTVDKPWPVPAPTAGLTAYPLEPAAKLPVRNRWARPAVIAAMVLLGAALVWVASTRIVRTLEPTRLAIRNAVERPFTGPSSTEPDSIVAPEPGARATPSSEESDAASRPSVDTDPSQATSSNVPPVIATQGIAQRLLSAQQPPPPEASETAPPPTAETDPNQTTSPNVPPAIPTQGNGQAALTARQPTAVDVEPDGASPPPPSDLPAERTSRSPRPPPEPEPAPTTDRAADPAEEPELTPEANDPEELDVAGVEDLQAEGGPVERPAMGTLILKITPGVSVTVDDGQPVTDPNSLELPAGRHTATLMSANGVIWRESVEIPVSGSLTIDRDLSRLGSINIRSDIGAKVSLNGTHLFDPKNLRQTPALVSNVPVGLHLVRVSREGYEPVEFELQVREGETTRPDKVVMVKKR